MDDLRRFLEEHEAKQVEDELLHKEVEELPVQQWLVDLDRSQASKEDMRENQREQDV